MNDRRTRIRVLSILGVAVLSAVAMAEVRLPAVFGEHMVVQRDVPIPVWGWADPGEKITVTFAGQTGTATTADDGTWSLSLAAMAAGSPHAFVVRGTNAIEFIDVLVGEVWLCSGQSNMAMAVRGCRDYEQEAAAATYPAIRMMTVARATAETAQADCRGAWVVCSPETVGAFSGTAYFFGRELHRELGIAVGLINSSWGGTPVQAWTRFDEQKAEPQLQSLLERWDKQIAEYDPEKAETAYAKQVAAWEEKAAKAKADGTPVPRKPSKAPPPRQSPHRPASLYNGMIAPLAPYAIRGAIWYQGESNAGRYGPNLYGMQLSMLIQNWRNVWPQGDFPFLWVQLPNFRAPQTQPSETSGWVIVQEQMRKALEIPHTGMAITIDIGEENDIHPKNKQDVGKRLALWALAKTYGRNGVASGPLYTSMARRTNAIVVSFEYADGGLVVQGDRLKGFALAGPDKQFVWADARVEGATVVVSSPEVAEPVSVRYAWAANPECNLYNRAGLPASPFRTDDWEQ